MNNNHVYDMLVVGGGPGGYTAALYAARAGLDTIVLEKLSAGGQMALTEQIDNYPGFENWYRVQAQEERDHAMLFCQYLQNNGEGVTFEAIAKPEWERGDHMAPLKRALEHEMLVTASINAIYAAAYEVRDFRTMQMLDWFIKEQGEEEKNAADLITKMDLFGGDSKGLYMLNSELKARVYTAPSLVSTSLGTAVRSMRRTSAYSLRAPKRSACFCIFSAREKPSIPFSKPG